MSTFSLDLSIDCPMMPPRLKRQSTDDVDAACQILSSQYSIRLEEIAEDDGGIFGPMKDLKAQHYYTEEGALLDQQYTGQDLKKVIKEITKSLPSQIEVNSRGSMFIRYDEDSPQYLRACLTGIEGTPYSSGVFIFDIYVPPQYPHVPPKVTHCTPKASMVKANNGPGGFSPNLHSDTGKVCLSLLGTWDGPGWNPASSNIYQVLSTVLWMILGAEHPYYMEPGFGGWEGNAPLYDTDPEKPSVLEYDEEVKFHTALLGILEPLKSPIGGFKSVVLEHLLTKRHLILSTLERWADKGTTALREKLNTVLSELKEEYKKVLRVKDVQEDVDLLVEEVEFIKKKISFLQEKVARAHVTRVEVPKAESRLRVGPKLLAAAEKRLAMARMILKEAKDRNDQII